MSKTTPDKIIFAELVAVFLQINSALWNKLSGKKEVADNGIQALLDVYGKDFQKLTDKLIAWRDQEEQEKQSSQLEVTTEKVGGRWCVCFKIDNQKFRLAPTENKDDATWMSTQLEKAFKKLK